MIRDAVLDDWQQVARQSADWAPLEARAEVVFLATALADEDAAAEALADFDIILSMRERTAFPAALVARLPRLRMFGITGKRAAAIDSAAMIRQGVTVCWTEGGTGAETAELALALMLAAVRGVPAGDAAIRAGGFQEGTAPGFRLAGKILGIIGLGRIGSLMAGYGRALGMAVLAWSPNLTAARATAAGAALATKDGLLARADVVSLHLVLSASTRGIVAAPDLARMKPGAVLVNTARGPLVDEAALVAALRTGRLIAALDVYDREPLPPDHPLRTLPNTVLTPHLGYGTVEIFATFHRQSIENALAFLDGAPIRVLQPPQA